MTQLIATDGKPLSSLDYPALIVPAFDAPTNPRVAIIRTSDRANFKRCRRKWDFESGLRRNRTPAERPSYFWIGTGGHFAMEDWHGHNYYGSPIKAFEAYCNASIEAGRHHRIQPPDDFDEQKAMGLGIMQHYLDWCTTRDPYKTVWINGEPQVEVKCQIEMPVNSPHYDKVIYQVTLDRLVEIGGEYWILDWKFFKAFNSTPLDWHGQLSAYIWAAQTMWDVPIAGGILHEFKKQLPNDPRILQNGTISGAKDQLTSHAKYKQALLDMHGSVNASPAKNIECLNTLASMETEHMDRFIKRTSTTRNRQQLEAEGSQIMMELEEMLNPDLPLYTNPTKDCGWDCSFADICLMMNRDDDWEDTLDGSSVSRSEEGEEWRQYLK